MTTTPTKNKSLPELPVTAMQDEFNGTDASVISAARALIRINDSGSLSSPLGGHARALLVALSARLEAALTREAPTEAVSDALRALLHAVCGETGFAAAVRADSGTPYPWPALDIAEKQAREALAATPPAPQRLAQGDVPGVPMVKESGPDASFVFSLLRDSQIIFRYLGWRGDDYELKHELRALALRLERGDFQAAMDWINAQATTQPPHHDRGEDLQQRAQELLAAEYEAAGWHNSAIAIRGNRMVDSQAISIRAITAALTEAKQQGPGEAEDAARWRALIGCARIRVLGSAGLTKDQPNNYAHLGLEVWTHHEAGNEGPAVEWLTKFADKARLVQAPQVEAKRQTGEGE